MQIKKPDLGGRLFVFILISTLAVAGTYVAFGLYADGSFYLLNVLRSRGFSVFQSRAFAQVATQAPVVFAMKIGIHDLNALIRIHSFGLIAIPLGFWLAALLLQIKTDLFWLFVVAFSVSYLTSGFDAAGEYNLAYGVTAFGASCLLRDTRVGLLGGLTLALAGVIAISAYEAMVFLGPLLFIIALWRLKASKVDSTVFSKATVALAAFLFAASFGVSLMFIIFPRDPQNLASAALLRPMLKTVHFIYIVLMGSLFLASLPGRRKLVKNMAFFLAGLLALGYLAHFSSWNSPSSNYSFRSLSGLMLFSVIAYAAGHYFSAKANFAAFRRPLSDSAMIPLLLFISFVIPFYFQVWGFYRWASAFEQEVVTRRGVIPIDTTKLVDAEYEPYICQWTNPSFSIVLRGDQPGAIIANKRSYDGWQPFEPDAVDQHLLQSFKKKSRLYFNPDS